MSGASVSHDAGTVDNVSWEVDTYASGDFSRLVVRSFTRPHDATQTAASIVTTIVGSPDEVRSLLVEAIHRIDGVVR